MASEIQIVDFKIGWNTNTGQGQVQLKASNGQSRLIQINSLADLAGWVALLKESPLFASADGWIHTGLEHVGE